MHASKEEARRADEALEEAIDMIDDAIGNPEQRDQINAHLFLARKFIHAAHAKLPTESAYARDKKRKRAGV